MNDNDFLEAIEAEPANAVPRLVYFDWLDDQGDPRGGLLRIQEELRHLNVPKRAEKEARMHELLNEGVEPLVITRTNSIGMQEVLIFPGEFLMGSPENEEGRNQNEGEVEVNLTQPFWLGKYAVTQAQWQKIIDTSPWGGEYWVEADPECPATYVAWRDAMNFCRKLADREMQAGCLPRGWEYSLPTEAQWEYACRAGTTTSYSFGKDWLQLRNYAWFDENAADAGQMYAHPVGQRKPNTWGLYDMHGNVWECCLDWWQEHLPGGIDPEVTTKSSLGSYKVFRGGTWHRDAMKCRSSMRTYLTRSYEEDDLGFRVAHVLSGQ
jgi:uncharacterized protein (TIGR02996 family)